MSEIFYWILNMSIVDAISGIVVMLVRKIKPIPRRFIFVLWAIPFLRMCVPVGLSSPYSLMTLLTDVIKRAVILEVDVSLSDILEISFMNSIAAAESYHPVTYKTDTIERVFSISSGIWMAVVIALLLFFVIAYIRNMSALKSATLYEENIYISKQVDSPCIIGIFKPRILIPENINMENLEYVIAHERAHIKNGDNFWKLLGLVISKVHWFNPFAWLFLKLAFADMEQACDERVLAGVGEDKKKEYALTLVDYAQKQYAFSSALGGGNVRSRVENILDYKKLSIFSGIVFVIFCLIVAFVLLTNAM